MYKNKAVGNDNRLLLCERVRRFSYEERKHGLAKNGNTSSVTVNCGGTDSYSDGSVGMHSGDNM